MQFIRRIVDRLIMRRHEFTIPDMDAPKWYRRAHSYRFKHGRKRIVISMSEKFADDSLSEIVSTRIRVMVYTHPRVPFFRPRSLIIRI